MVVTATNSWSPATRIFEAAGAGACPIGDERRRAAQVEAIPAGVPAR